MKLSKLDNKKVKLIDIEDIVFEGLATYDSSEYNYHEYGKDEESIDIGCMKFYKSIIKSIEEIDEFEKEYGEIEIEIAQDDDLIEEQLSYEDDNSIRLKNYIKDHEKEILENNKGKEEHIKKLLEEE